MPFTTDPPAGITVSGSTMTSTAPVGITVSGATPLVAFGAGGSESGAVWAADSGDAVFAWTTEFPGELSLVGTAPSGLQAIVNVGDPDEVLLAADEFATYGVIPSGADVELRIVGSTALVDDDVGEKVQFSNSPEGIEVT